MGFHNDSLFEFGNIFNWTSRAQYEFWPLSNTSINAKNNSNFLMSLWNPGGSGRGLRVKGGFYNYAVPLLQCEANGNYGENVRFVVLASGNVGIDTDAPGYKLHLADGDFVMSCSSVNNFKVSQTGFVIARQFAVNLQPIPDFVFKRDYELMPLHKLEKYVLSNNHLPGIKSEKEYKEAGSINLAELDLQLLQKVEVLNLYVIQLQKQIDQLKVKN